MEYVLVGVIVVLIALIVLIAVLFLRSFRDMLLHLERTRHAHHEQLEGLVDRTLAKSWESYKEWKAAEPVVDDAEEGFDSGARMMTREENLEAAIERPWSEAMIEALPDAEVVA